VPTITTIVNPRSSKKLPLAFFFVELLASFLVNSYPGLMTFPRSRFMKKGVPCPKCGHLVSVYRNPIPAADVIIRVGNSIVLIKRRNPPHGWALPGGFIDYGEAAEHAALREAKEETGLDVERLELFGVYSAPDRDPRFHTLSIVFTGWAKGVPKAADDAADIGLFMQDTLPLPLAFDHAKILEEFFARAKNR
jgi:ADP-ribose pyrophosphatase YjhB (NUDIX family)